MLDVILIPEGETAHTFDLALALDREHPTQTALGMVTPVPVVPTAKGPPHRRRTDLLTGQESAGTFQAAADKVAGFHQLRGLRS